MIRGQGGNIALYFQNATFVTGENIRVDRQEMSRKVLVLLRPFPTPIKRGYSIQAKHALVSG